MNVSYVHTFEITVEGTDSFDDGATLAKAIEYGDRDARHVTVLVKRGGLEPKPVRSQHKTKTVIVHE